MAVAMIYLIRRNQRETQVYSKIISLKYFQASDSLHCTYALIHFTRTRGREWSAIGNRLIGIIRQYWQFVAPISRFPVCHSRLSCKILRQLFFVDVESRAATFRFLGAIVSVYISALFVSTTVIANLFLRQFLSDKLRFRRKTSECFLTVININILLLFLWNNSVFI